MSILAVNCGSSSIKVRLFEADRSVRLMARGLAERIGRDSGSISLRIEDGQECRRELPLPDHRAATHALHHALVEGDPGLAERAQVALDVFVYRIQKHIGAYVAAMNGVDAVVFTGGIGENSPYLRQRVAANLGYPGAHVDPEKNDRSAAVFSSDDSSPTLLAIPANEELVIAQQTYGMLAESMKTAVRKWKVKS